MDGMDDGMPFHDFVMDIHIYSPCHCSLRQHLEQNLGILSHVYLRQADVDLQQLGSTRGNAATGVSFGQRTNKLAPHAPLKACTFKGLESAGKAPKTAIILGATLFVAPDYC